LERGKVLRGKKPHINKETGRAPTRHTFDQAGEVKKENMFNFKGWDFAGKKKTEKCVG